MRNIIYGRDGLTLARMVLWQPPRCCPAEGHTFTSHSPTPPLYPRRMMTRTFTKLSRAALLGAAVLATTACGGGSANEDVAYVARDVESLYAEAQRRLDDGNTLLAA
ncbi:MAG: hypothetical protein V2I43_03205, partial [Parvularcula sp.]|nr:hypothetical protein [Parvularcula sp.]